MIKVNPNLPQMLNDAGYTCMRIRKERILGQSQYYNIKNCLPIMTLQTLDTLCRILHVQPQDIITYEDDHE